MEKININSFPFVKLILLVLPSLLIGIVLPSSFAIFLIFLCGIFGIFSLLLKKQTISYLFLCFSIGLILSFNYKQVKNIRTTTHFTVLYSKLYGKVTDCAFIDSTRVIIRVSGHLHNEKIQKYKTAVQLTIFDDSPKVKKIEVGDFILCNTKIRPPRQSKLPTDPPEPHIALINDVEFFGTVYPKGVVKIWKEEMPFQRIFANVTIFLSNRLREIFDPKNQSFFFALLLGNRELLTLEQREKFAMTGMSHILALSGFHFGILATILFYLFSFLKNNWTKLVLISFALISYLIIVKLPPSGIRATIMILAFLFASTLERNVNFLNTLGLILIIILVFFPSTIFTIGFQLSFFAVLGIGLFYRRFYQFFTNTLPIKSKSLLFFTSILCLTLSAQIITAPLVAFYFGYYTFISFFSNLILLPLFTLSIAFGFVALLLSSLSLVLGKPFAITADFIFSLTYSINERIAKTFEALVLTENGVTLLAIIISIIIIWILADKRPKRILMKTAFAISIVCLLIINIKESAMASNIEVYPRSKYVAVILKTKGKNYCLLLDRKPRQFPSTDKPMVNYLAKLPGDLIVGVSGNAGIAVSDDLKAIRKATILEIPKEIQREISNSIFGDLSLFKN